MLRGCRCQWRCAAQENRTHHATHALDTRCLACLDGAVLLGTTIGVRGHIYMLAFALTDFKLQGRTLPKLILSFGARCRLPLLHLHVLAPSLTRALTHSLVGSNATPNYIVLCPLCSSRAYRVRTGQDLRICGQ